jgi:hypothetical protein
LNGRPAVRGRARPCAALWQGLRPLADAVGRR